MKNKPVMNKDMNDRGYTLLELLVVVGVIVTLIGAGMRVFYQSLKSSSQVDFELFMDTSGRVIENSMKDLIGFGRVVSVAGQDQDSCLVAGNTGLLGDELTIKVADKLTSYTLETDYIASSSTNPVKQVRVSPEGVVVSNLSFKWVCLSGEREKIRVSFTLQVEKEGQTVPIEEDYFFEMILKNSGYY